MSFTFDANETPEQAKQRRNAAVMGALQQGVMQQPQDMGQGIASLGNALALRSMQGQQQQPVNPTAPVAPGSDPWAGMRGQAGSSPFSALKGLFGLGVR